MKLAMPIESPEALAFLAKEGLELHVQSSD